MKLLTLLTPTLLLLLPSALALPLDPASAPDATPSPTDLPAPSSTAATAPEESATGAAGGGKIPTAIQAANNGTPHCKTAALEELCTSVSSGAYCDSAGFHCNLMPSCKSVCWCD
ncbi:hypothetical protein C8A05DRAFT_33251 [Staphylotrichum tortipilum]|uniref:Uncharacterized protein n=1 Tax=Staphylotrichum tortipilum TaxID=2831512 RepID=A0AAN6RUX2_9PEZI|nr:hypothetical protein C8A05DRAFT_33251 [Staphylotrichum longicolle]